MVPLPGPHQVENAITAVNAARELNERGLKLSDEKIVAGIAKASIPARFETISHDPLVVVDGEMISEEEFAGYMTRIKTVNDLLEKSGCNLTQFELITAVAFLWFAEKECDVVVLECGLGGRLDSTNVIKEPLCSVITKISLDHTDILGDTVEKIAGEKAGIIKPGCPVVLAPNQRHEVVSVIVRRCAEIGSPLTVSGMDTVSVKAMLPTMTEVNYAGLRLMVPLPGPHQVENRRGHCQSQHPRSL